MQPIISIEFTTKAGDADFSEEAVSLHSPEELLSFIAPGGGCESIPDAVDEIQMVFLPQNDRARANPVAERRVTLELGMIFLTGPLYEIVQAAGLILDKANRGELSASFLRAIGIEA